jgi:hypothetical protein
VTGVSPLVDELLEGWGIARALPDARFLDELYRRFGAFVPYETVTRTADGDSLEDVLSALVEGAGSAGARRTRAFLAIARDLGFDAGPVAGTVLWRRGDGAPLAGDGDPHAALVVSVLGRRFLVDPAYPLPWPVPLEPPAADMRSPWGTLSVRTEGRSTDLVCEGLGRLTARIRYDLTPVEDVPSVPIEEGPLLLRLLDDRLHLWRAGEMRVVDSWSVLTHPVPASEKAALAVLFSGAEAIVEELPHETPDSPPPAALVVFERTRLPLHDVKARLGSPEGLFSLYAPGGRFELAEVSGSGWIWKVFPGDDDAVRTERVTRTGEGVAADVLDEGAFVASRRYGVEPLPDGETLLSLEALFGRPLSPRGLGESVRKTLVFHLASELLALGRD